MLQKGTVRAEVGLEVPGHFDKGNFGGDEDLIGGGLRMNRRSEIGILQQRGAK